MIVVDSSVWISYLRGNFGPQTAKLERAGRERRIIVGDLVLLEILRGARDEDHASSLARWMSAFRQEAMLGPDLAREAAARYRDLRGLGITVRKTADLVIANFCVSRGYALLHQNRDFDLMAGPLGLTIV